MADDGKDNPVSAYKSLLRDMIDRRPSGTRQRIAVALGKHKSFVSQITNPAYAVPVPEPHLATIFELCHFSAEERRLFLQAYHRAHPGRVVRPDSAMSEPETTITIHIPSLKDPRRQAELVDSIRLYADHAVALAKKWDDGKTGDGEKSPQDKPSSKASRRKK